MRPVIPCAEKARSYYGWTEQSLTGDAGFSMRTSAVPGNLCLGSLTYRNRLSSSVSVVPDLRHSPYRVRLPPR